VYAGYALPVPMLLGLASAAYRADLSVLDRFTREDWRWLRSRNRRDGTFAVGKFNAGQKLNASLVAGSVLVMVGTGTLMFFTGLVRLSWRTGATFVHDWFALGLGLLVLGHVWFAIADPQAREGMRRGRVDRRWAEREHPAWVDELSSSEAAGRAAPSGTGRGRARRR
jgi:formate dehydrogenase subunit gamma